MLIDDHAVLASTLATALEMNGFTDVIQTDPRERDDEELLAEADRHDAALVVVDLFLGDERLGLELVRSLTATGRDVVVLTGTTQRVMHVRALSAGAAAVLQKGAALEEVLT